MKTKSLLNRKVQLAFGVAILTLLVAGTISYYGLVVSGESDKWVRHTHEVLENLQSLLSEIQSVESNFRGMVVTGDESYVKSYRANIASAEQYELTVAKLTVDNPEQQRRLPALKRLAAQKIQFIDDVMNLRGTRGFQAAADAISEGTGQLIMDEFQALIREMQDEELRLLKKREVVAKRHLDQTKAALVLGTLMGLFTSALAVWSVQRDSFGRALAEVALRDSEVKFRGILESAPDAMVIADGKGHIILVNAETERLFGYGREELVGQLVDILVPERFRGKHPQHREGYTAHPRTRTMSEGQDLWGLRKDNTEFPVEISLSPIETPEGTLISSAIRDVTASKRAEKALRASEIKLRGILESAPDAMVIADGQGRIVLVNAETERLFGYGREELVGQLVEILVPERFRGKHPQHREGYTAHPRNRLMGEGLELRELRKDATEFPIEISLSPLESPEGILVTAAIRDITERKQVEEALRLSEERLSLLIHGVKDYAILMLDTEGRVTTWGDGAERIKGYRADEIIGQHFSKFYGPEDLLQDKPYRELKIAAEQGRFEEEGWRVRKDGSRFWASVIITALHDKAGQLCGFGKVTRDISERKKSEEQLAKTMAELKRSNDELGQFAYVASHDLQEPLRMMASYTQLLGRRYKGRLDADADEFIAYAVDGSNRMQGLIQDLLAYSRAGTNGKPLLEISTEKALNEALANLRTTIQESGAGVTHDALPVVTTDDKQLALVFQNLVGNAIKYRSAEVPQFHVSAAKNGGKEWIFSVRDNGLGIDPQYFERIFVLFQRLHGRETFEGTGIGLAICKKIVERLGGRIWVESRPEKGSTFYFALPERKAK